MNLIFYSHNLDLQRKRQDFLRKKKKVILFYITLNNFLVNTNLAIFTHGKPKARR